MQDSSITLNGRSQPLRFGAGPLPGDMKQCSAEEAVKAVYRQVLKREADPSGAQYYVQFLVNGTSTVRDLVRELVLSKEWKSTFIDGRNVSEIVIALYSCVLARAPDTGGWDDFMAWSPRGDWSSVLEGFVNSEEYTGRFGNDSVPGREI